MKQEYEDLLLKDLCARSSYGVKVLADINKTFDGGIISEVVCINLRKERVELDDVITPFHYDEVKPYLRPMSSMTEEEKQELYSWGDYEMISWISDEEICLKDLTLSYELLTKLTDWFNANFFDYRGLIELGLALEAPEGMYK